MFSQAWIIEFAKTLCLTNAWYAFLVLIIGFAERRWPAGEQPKNSDIWFNFANAFLAALLFAVALRPLASIHAFLKSHGLAGVLVGNWSPKTLAEIILATVFYAFVYDFFQYWAHRAQHRSKYLWPAHALHHDDRRVNTTTALRNTFWHGVINSLWVHVPTYMLCGSEIVVFYASMLLFSTYGFLNHANIRGDMGVFTKIVSGPAWHRVHHGRPREYFDKNFAAFFPFYDLLFGTYKAPDPETAYATGLSQRPQARGGFLSLLLAVFGFRVDPRGPRDGLMVEVDALSPRRGIEPCAKPD